MHYIVKIEYNLLGDEQDKGTLGDEKSFIKMKDYAREQSLIISVYLDVMVTDLPPIWCSIFFVFGSGVFAWIRIRFSNFSGSGSGFRTRIPNQDPRQKMHILYFLVKLCFGPFLRHL